MNLYQQPGSSLLIINCNCFLIYFIFFFLGGGANTQLSITCMCPIHMKKKNPAYFTILGILKKLRERETDRQTDRHRGREIKNDVLNLINTLHYKHSSYVSYVEMG